MSEVERLRHHVLAYCRDSGIVAEFEAAVRLEQIEADCRASCDDCDRLDRVRFWDERRIWVHERSGQECDAFPIRCEAAHKPEPGS